MADNSGRRLAVRHGVLERPAPALAGLPRCANCSVEIPWRPATLRGQTFCCGGCAQGGPCYCSYDLATHEAPRPGRRHAPGGAPFIN